MFDEMPMCMCAVQILEKKKLIDGLIKSAYADTDHLAPFPSFQHYTRDGILLLFLIYLLVAAASLS